MKRILFWAGWLGFAVCGALLAFQALRSHWATRELYNPVARGRRLAEQLGCFGCHGPEGGHGAPNPGSATGKVPSLHSETLMMDARNVEQIREYIALGYPEGRVGSAAWKQAQAAALKMPAFQDRLSSFELEDLVTYYTSVNDTLDLPDAARPGRELALSLGCFNCHGRDGSGGVRNPGSFKGYVPGWIGPDFAELAQDEGELREWILKGGLKRLDDNPAARAFLDSQQVQMPPYESLLSREKLDSLVAYIQALRVRRSPR
jgi:mono/diheme cytochrome c family protein